MPLRGLGWHWIGPEATLVKLAQGLLPLGAPGAESTPPRPPRCAPSGGRNGFSLQPRGDDGQSCSTLCPPSPGPSAVQQRPLGQVLRGTGGRRREAAPLGLLPPASPGSPVPLQPPAQTRDFLICSSGTGGAGRTQSALSPSAPFLPGPGPPPPGALVSPGLPGHTRCCPRALVRCPSARTAPGSCPRPPRAPPDVAASVGLPPAPQHCPPVPMVMDAPLRRGLGAPAASPSTEGRFLGLLLAMSWGLPST